MKIRIGLGDVVDVVVSDDQPYSPDVLDDMAARALKTAIELHRELLTSPATDDGA